MCFDLKIEYIVKNIFLPLKSNSPENLLIFFSELRYLGFNTRKKN